MTQENDYSKDAKHPVGSGDTPVKYPVGSGDTPVKHPVGINDIKGVVAYYYALDPSELTTKTNRMKIVEPRQIAMYLSRALCSASYKKIALSFGINDHTTVIHAVRKINRLSITDIKIRADIGILTEIIIERSANPEPEQPPQKPKAPTVEQQLIKLQASIKKLDTHILNQAKQLDRIQKTIDSW